MADAKLSALTAATVPAPADVLYVVQGTTSKKVPLSVLQTYIGSPISSHILETDPSVHSAAKISYSGTVPSSANVKEALEVLETRVVEASAVTVALDALDDRALRLEDLAGGNRATIDNFVGAGTRTYWEDDFRYTVDAAGGRYGEKGWLVFGGTAATGTQTLYHPGVLRVSTLATTNTYTPLYAPGTMFGAGALFDVNMWFRPPTIDANTSYRCGLTTADPTQSAADQQILPSPNGHGVWVEHLGADPAFWFNTYTLAGSATRVQTTVATVANQWIHVHVWRYSATHVAITYNVTAAGVPGPTSIAELVPFAPASAFLRPFVSVKNLTGVIKDVDFDCCGVLTVDLNR